MRATATGLATAFYRLLILEALASGPARPQAILGRVGTDRLPLATGGFSRALQSLLEGRYLAPGDEGAVSLTALGAAERMAERERWSKVLPIVARMVGESAAVPSSTFAVAETAVRYRTAEVAEQYLDRVLVSAIRERIAQARDGGRAFTLVLGVLDIDASGEATRRAMVHRAIRATLGGASTVFGGDTNAFRYGDNGVAVVAPILGDAARGAHVAALLRARLDELLRSMTMSVRAFQTARWRVRVGDATWATEIAASGVLLRLAQDALARDDAVGRAA